MEKNNTVKFIALGAAAFALAGGIFYYLNASDETEDEASGVISEGSKREQLNMDQIKEMLNKDISGLKSVEKNDANGLTEEFLLAVFGVLKKYVTLVQLVDESSQFDERIELLKQGKEEEYDKIKDDMRKENEERIKVVTGALYSQLEFTDIEYATGIQRNAYNPQFTEKWKAIDLGIATELQEYQVDSEIPEELTIEKAKEIRSFVQEETKKILAEVQSQGGSQETFQDKFVKEIAKLDDVIFIKYGFKNTEVLKAFHEYKLIQNQGGAMTR